jgi:hypothetical protein
MVRLQNPVVSTITTVFTACSSFGLIAVSTWFLFERWVFLRHRGTKWLRDSLDECWIAVAEVVSRRRLLSAMHRASDPFVRAKALLCRLVRPHPSDETIIPSSDSWSSLTHAPSSSIGRSPYDSAECFRTGSLSPIAPTPPEEPISGHSLNAPQEVTGISGAAAAAATPARRARFVQAIRSVIMAQQGPTGISRASLFNPECVRQEELRGLIRSSRVARLAPKLRDFAPTQEFAAHQALVRHLQFSPNGNFLATSRLGFSLYSRKLPLIRMFVEVGTTPQPSSVPE